jgi:hypothetical protein
VTQVVARLKRKSVELRKVMSIDRDILIVPKFDDSLAFDPHYKPDDGEWLFLSEFSKTQYAIEGLGAVVNTAGFPQLEAAQAKKVKFLCILQGDCRLYQKLVPSSVLRKKWLKVSGDFSLVEDEEIIILNETPDAIHDTESDRLYFRDFSILKTFFSKIEELYREATDAEVKDFLGQEIISLGGGFSADKVGKPNRKRIALAAAKLQAFTPQNIEQMIQEFPEYVNDVEIKEGRFVIKNDRDLKMSIYCLEERFYTTSISKERRLANSVLQLGGRNN